MTPDHKSRWKLSTISNVALLVLYLIGSVLLVSMVNYNTKQQALHNAELYSSMILDRNVVTHAFFNNVLKTSLSDLNKDFISEHPNWLSSSFAINSMADDYGLFTEADLYYKEAAVNARNPVHEADTFERRFLSRLNENSELKLQSTINEYDGEPCFTVLRRGQTISEDCLHCHGDPADAPEAIVSHYGRKSGFHRQAGDVASVISIRIPLALAYQDANAFSIKLSAVLLLLLLIIFAFQYVVTRQLLFAPINAIYSQAHVIAFDPEHLGDELPLPVGRELAEMVEAFNAMSKGLRQHQDSLEETISERTSELKSANEALNRDIEIRKQVETSLAQLGHRNEMILDTTSEGILGLNADGVISFYNRAAADMLGLTGEDEHTINLLNQLRRFKADSLQPDPAEQVKDVLKRGKSVENKEGLLVHLKEHSFAIEYSCAPLTNETITGAVFSFKDITERKRAEREIKNLAFYDQLTRLANRTLFYDRLKQRVAQAARDKQKLAVMFFDLDDFKIVNDSLGHDAGDEFLKVVASRLKEESRQADTVARLGGDEFVWFGEILDKHDAELIADKFLHSISQPIMIKGRNLASTVSIGIALFPDNAEDVIGLMKYADTAMYSAKNTSKNAYHFYRSVRDT